MIDVAKWMHHYLNEKGMTQADIARKSGLSTAIVAQMASGRTKDPRVGNVIKVADAFGISLDTLYSFEVGASD